MNADPMHPPGGIATDRRSRLLAVSGVAPWPVRGGFSLRAAHLLEALSEWWDLSLVVAEPMDADLAPWRDPERHEVGTVDLPVRWRPVPPVRHLEVLRRKVGETIARRQPDAALLFNGSEFLALGHAFPPSVADRIDCGALERFRYVRRSRNLRLLKTVVETVAEARYERRIVRELFATTVAGADDAAALRAVAGVDRVHVVPNGVHTLPGPAFEAESRHPTVVFTGTLSYYANVDAVRYFVHAIWPGIRDRVEGARLVIAGRRPARRVLALSRVPGVEIRSDVPDMRAVLREAWVAVAPMRCGAGVKNKVLEAWAAGRPVVMLPRAANGLIFEAPARDLVVRGAEEFADRVVRLLRDAELRHAHGAAAQDQVRRRQSWTQSAEMLSRLLRAAGRNGLTNPDSSRIRA